MTSLPENALSSLRNLAGLASLYHDLGYPADKPESFTPEEIGLESAEALVKRATLMTHLEGGKTRFQNSTPLGTWLTIVPVEGVGFREGKTSCLSTFLPASNEPSFSWDKVNDPNHT